MGKFHYICKSITWGKVRLKPLLGYRENLKPEPVPGYRETPGVENVVLDCCDSGLSQTIVPQIVV
jgi:hypothetical protein